MRPSVPTSVILDAAAAAAAEFGFARVTMDDIAARAGVAKGVLYLRFPNKEELVAATVAHEVRGASRVTLAAVEADPRGGLLSHQFTHSIAALHSRPALLRLYRDGASAIAHTSRSDRDPVESRIGVEYIRELQASGMAHELLDAGVLARNLTLWASALLARAPHEDLDALIRGMGELIAAAVDADPPNTDPGKRCFALFVDALTSEEQP